MRAPAMRDESDKDQSDKDQATSSLSRVRKMPFRWIRTVRSKRVKTVEGALGVQTLRSTDLSKCLPDTPVDITKLKQAKQLLQALQGELSDTEETNEMDQIMTHVDILQDLLRTTKKMKCGFPTVSYNDLSNLGLERRLLEINEDVLAQRLENSAARGQIMQLCEQITQICRFVSLQYEPGARMILDAVLLTVAKISANGEAKLPVAIYPGMQVSSGDGVSIVNPTTNFEMWLTGNVDYALCTYINKSHQSRVLNTTMDNFIRFSHNCITLVKSKHKGQHLTDCMPEAISQAMALSEVTKINTVRFCLSDGQNWIFSLLTKDEQGNRVCYEGEIIGFTITTKPDLLSFFQQDVHKVVKLMYHWLVASDDPLTDSLYILKS